MGRPRGESKCSLLPRPHQRTVEAARNGPPRICHKFTSPRSYPPGRNSRLTDDSKIGGRCRPLQAVIQLPGLADIARLQGCKRVGLGLLAFRRRMVSSPLPLQELVVNYCRANVLSELRRARRCVVRCALYHLVNDFHGNPKLAGQRCILTPRKLAQPFEVSLNHAANVEDGRVCNLSL